MEMKAVASILFNISFRNEDFAPSSSRKVNVQVIFISCYLDVLGYQKLISIHTKRYDSYSFESRYPL